MKKLAKLTSVSGIALILAAPAFAQGALVGTDALDDQIDDIQENVAEDTLEGDDDSRFGSNQYPAGWSGSVSLGLSSTSGNTDTTDLSVAGRMRYGAGVWNHTFGFAGEYADDDETRYKEQAYATYEANRYFTESFYAFGLGSVSYDDFASNRYDAFIGAGPGIRIVNTDTIAWRVQAGPGYRYIEDQDGNESDDFAGIAASRFYYRLSENAFLSNDTDVLFSETDTSVRNDLGVTVRVVGSISTRVSYLTDYVSDPLPGKEHYDNTLGVSLVYGF